eukprot:3701042-Pyramimonas_sp.AAC.1
MSRAPRRSTRPPRRRSSSRMTAWMHQPGRSRTARPAPLSFSRRPRIPSRSSRATPWIGHRQ